MLGSRLSGVTHASFLLVRVGNFRGRLAPSCTTGLVGFKKYKVPSALANA